MFFSTLTEEQKKEYEQAEQERLLALNFCQSLIEKIKKMDDQYIKNRASIFFKKLYTNEKLSYPEGWENSVFSKEHPEIFKLEREIISAYKSFLEKQEYVNLQNKKLDYVSLFYAKDAGDFLKAFSTKISADGREEKSVKMPNPKSIALLSYLFSLKDNCDHQPIVASSRDSFKKIIKEMLKTSPETEVTVIYNPVVEGYPGSNGKVYSRNHKTCAKIIRTEQGLTVVSIDSVYSLNSKDPAFNAYINSIPEMTEELRQDICESKDDSDIDNVSITYKKIASSSKRQFDQYSCALFAVKDARELNRTIDQPLYDAKKIPLQFLKSLQSLSEYKTIKNDYAGETDNKGRTLDEVIHKHTKIFIETDKQTGKEIAREKNTYIRHFEDKYMKKIHDFVTTHPAEEVYSHIIKYDAAHIDAATLEARWKERKTQTEKNILIYAKDYSANEAVPDARHVGRKNQQRSHFKKT